MFDQIQQLIKSKDHTSLDYLLKWEHHKSQIFRLKNNDGMLLIHIACLEGSKECVFVMIEHGADVHAKSSVGWTALHAATLGELWHI